MRLISVEFKEFEYSRFYYKFNTTRSVDNDWKDVFRKFECVVGLMFLHLQWYISNYSALYAYKRIVDQ